MGSAIYRFFFMTCIVNFENVKTVDFLSGLGTAGLRSSSGDCSSGEAGISIIKSLRRGAGTGLLGGRGRWNPHLKGFVP